jgi:hypothetical protein
LASEILERLMYLLVTDMTSLLARIAVLS